MQPPPLQQVIEDWLIERVTQGPPDAEDLTELTPGYEYEYVISSVEVTVSFFVLVSSIDLRISVDRFSY